MLLTIKFFTGVTKPPEEIGNTLFLPLSFSLCFLAVNDIGLTLFLPGVFTGYSYMVVMSSLI